MPSNHSRHVAKKHMRSALLFGIFLFSPITGLQEAKATVLEFDAQGSAVVTEAQNRQSKPAPTHKIDLQYRNLAQDVALEYSGSAGVRKAGLDAITFIDVFKTLIDKESAYNPEALSEKGAMGLGQLMPDTANDMGVEDPFDPRSNLVGSAKYFTTLLNEFGSLELALAAYNAGPQRVRDYNGVPPYRETKEYISWISLQAGLEPSKSESASPKEEPNSTEKPLNGDVSVWEF